MSELARSNSSGGGPSRQRVPTVSDILRDRITALATEHWAPNAGGDEPKRKRKAFSEAIIDDIFDSELNRLGNLSRLQLLDFTCYLENYLWPNYSASSGRKHVLSIVMLVNEKFRDGVGSSVAALAEDEEKFSAFFKAVVRLSLCDASDLPSLHKSFVMQFLVNIYQSLEHLSIRKACLPYMSLPLWLALSPARLQRELAAHPALKKHWQHLVQQTSASASASNEGKAAAPAEQEEAEATPKKRGRAAAPKAAPKGKKAAAASPASVAASDSMSEEEKRDKELLNTWIPTLFNKFLESVENHPADEVLGFNERLYVEHFLELCIDLLSQLPTRRFLNTLLDDMHFVIRCRRSSLWTARAEVCGSDDTRPVVDAMDPEGTDDAPSTSVSDNDLFRRLVDAIDDLIHFEVQDQSGKALSAVEVAGLHSGRLHHAQAIAYKQYKDALGGAFVYSSIGELGKPEMIRKYLQLVDQETLTNFAVDIGALSSRDVGSNYFNSPGANPFVIDALIDFLKLRPNQLDALNQTPLYPTERELWDPRLIPAVRHGGLWGAPGDSALALPKLNLQFLTMHDYLVRNFTLFKLESAYEIRQDLCDAVRRMAPRQFPGSPVTFGGWSRMTVPVSSFSFTHIAKPNIGEECPSHVKCIVEIDISRFQGVIRQEWESFREHDVVFLITFENPAPSASAGVELYKQERSELALGRRPKKREEKGSSYENDMNFPREFGIKYIRGGEVYEFRDEENVVLNDFTRPDERKSGRVGAKRKLYMKLDPAQYYKDIKENSDGGAYDRFHLLLRRDPRSNNFKAVLETIRQLINTEAIGRAVPAWLHDVILGYGSPDSAHYRKLPLPAVSVLQPALQALVSSSKAAVTDEIFDYTDTFLDAEHIKECFPGVTVESPSVAGPASHYRVVISRDNLTPDGSKDKVVALPYELPIQGPYPRDQRPANYVRFTKVQIEAIRSGMNEGLTMIVGPPGTGKTDVAVQTIVNLYHSFPNQKILLVTHSNAALNDLFRKIMARNVDPRHLLRLGSGEKSLLSNEDGTNEYDEQFSKQGRVNWSLSRRIELLAEVQRLATSLGVAGDVGSSCETADFFFVEHIQPRIDSFRGRLGAATVGQEDASVVVKSFPFHSFFADAPELFSDSAISYEQAVTTSSGCIRHISNLFKELADYRAFELLRSQAHRADYLLTKQARIVAMTCTHAAMTRGRLVELGFKYDSMIMEEAAQILEVETLIPMLLQNTDAIDGCRLKRVVLIGDHNQLPPILKHPVFQRHAKMDQSMFARFVRLGAPRIQLDQQGRARKEIASLYSWRYRVQKGPSVVSALRNLPFIDNFEGRYRHANAGFVHNFQMVDVGDFKGHGEACPTAHFYQNLGEAEYVVAVYMYMRLLGYPAEKISIITTYNGQKSLIRDIIAQRCKSPVFGPPAAITTVDKFQGQQNDYILLSMVRTEAVGHIRDVRRLVVALSRARLGLYVFCRRSLFENCYELSPAFSQLSGRPSKLQLVVGEGFPTTRTTPELASSAAAEAAPSPAPSRGSKKAAAAAAAASSASTSTSAPEIKVHEVQDVTEMGVLVYQMVQQAQNPLQ